MRRICRVVSLPSITVIMTSIRIRSGLNVSSRTRHSRPFVAAASTGRESLVLLDSFKPDLILMDVMMPVMDGNETTRQIRHMPGWGDVPIIAVTASASPDDERKSRDAGASALIAKPVDHDLLLRTIGRLLALQWITGQPAPEGGDGAALAVPPADEIEALWQLAQIGNMRKIRERAAYLRGLDPAYAPFANRLDTLAQGYHSKQLVVFVARFRNNSEKVLDDRSV
jgi:CheY-like chemotaxis protein